MESLAPIVLFVYNRPEHTSRTIACLKENTLAKDTKLIIYSDGPKKEHDLLKVREVRKILKEINGFKSVEIIERLTNMGLANSVITGVEEVFNDEDKIIVMEDDLECTSDFLDFMNSALNKYKNEQYIFSVSGYSYPLKSLQDYPYSAYLSYRGSSWSWATWKDRWNLIDWEIKDQQAFIEDKDLQSSFNRSGGDLSGMLIKQIKGTIDSWAIRFAYNAHKLNKVHVLASKSKVNNIGQDNSGTHSRSTKKYNVQLVSEALHTFPDFLTVNPGIEKEMKNFFHRSLVKRIISNIKQRL